MSLYLAEGTDPKKLEQFGFKLGRDYFGKARWCGDGSGHRYMSNWYHKFLLDPDNIDGADNIYYTEDDIPMVHIMVRIGDGNDLYVDCAPSCTYHISTPELDIVLDTVYELIQAGLLEMRK